MHRVSANDNSSQEQVKSLKSLETEIASVKKNLKGQQSYFSGSENGLMNITNDFRPKVPPYIGRKNKQCTAQRRGYIIVASHQDLQHFQFQKSLPAIDMVLKISTRRIHNKTY